MHLFMFHVKRERAERDVLERDREDTLTKAWLLHKSHCQALGKAFAFSIISASSFTFKHRKSYDFP